MITIDMSKKLQDLLNLPDPCEKPEEIPEKTPEYTREELMVEAAEIMTALTTSEKVDAALSTVTGLREHDADMDDISAKALKTYEDLCSLGLNIADPHTGKIYEVASQMLSIALTARDAKMKRKLEMVDLQIRKLRVDKVVTQDGSEASTTHSAEFDRNELLASITQTMESNTADKKGDEK